MTLEDAVVATDDAGNVIAFDATSGAERWRYSLAGDDGAGQVRGIAPGDGLVYAAGPEGLVALGASDGSRAWRYRVKTEGPLPDMDGFFWPITVGDIVYGVTQASDADMTPHRSVVAIDGATGDERWSSTIADGQAFGAPTSDGTLVMVAPGDGSLTALDASTGTVAWSVPLDAAPVTRAAIGDGVTYVGLSGGTVVALATADGSEAWRSPLDSGTVTAVTAVGDTLYADGTTTLYALDAATGAERWRYAIGSGGSMFPFSVIPVVTADSVYVGSTDADAVRIAAVDARTGEPRWVLQTEIYGALLASVGNGGRLFVVAYDLLGSGGLLSLGDPAG